MCGPIREPMARRGIFCAIAHLVLVLRPGLVIQPPNVRLNLESTAWLMLLMDPGPGKNRVIPTALNPTGYTVLNNEEHAELAGFGLAHEPDGYSSRQ